MNKLEHLRDFQQLLNNYSVSKTSANVLNNTKLVLLAAPTSTGRNTLIQELLKTGKYHYIVSDTTRKPRINDGTLERDGVEYWFRSEDEMLEDLRLGKFLEAAIIHDQQVSGISVREIGKASQDNKVAITDIEVVGVHNIVLAKPDTICIFVLPPSFEEWQRRINERGHMDPSELKRRLKSAAKELRMALDEPYYVFVVNDDLNRAVEDIDNIATGSSTGSTIEDMRKYGRRFVDDLYHKTQEHLSTLD